MANVIISDNPDGDNVFVTYLTGESPMEDVIAAHFTGIDYEIVDESTLPDQYGILFDAWRRNGTSITVDMPAAKSLLKSSVRLRAMHWSTIVEKLDFAGVPASFTVSDLQTALNTLVSNIDAATTPDELVSLDTAFNTAYEVDESDVGPY